MGRKFVQVSFLIAVVCSIISQLPFLLMTSTASILKCSWLLPILCCLFISPNKLFPKALIPFFVFVSVFFLYCFALQAFTTKQYVGTDFNNICYSLGITMVSYCVWCKVGNQKFLNQVVMCSLITCMILALNIYTEFLASANIESRSYAYTSKNSAAQILLNCIILFLASKYSKRLFTIVSIIIVLCFAVEIFLLKSRATILGLFFAVGYLAFFTKNRQIKRIVQCFGVLCLVYFICNTAALDSIVNNFLLGNRDASNLDDVSSGRFTIISSVIMLFNTSPWTGVGNLYVDCFPVSVLAQFGILGSVIVLLFILYLIKEVFFRLKANSPLFLANYLLVATILINSLFEAQPPFGPGMKCFIIWMIFGFSLASYSEGKRLGKLS